VLSNGTYSSGLNMLFNKTQRVGLTLSCIERGLSNVSGMSMKWSSRVCKIKIERKKAYGSAGAETAVGVIRSVSRANFCINSTRD